MADGGSGGARIFFCNTKEFITLILLIYTGRKYHYYRPQKTFAKVMFSQVFLCPVWGEGGVTVQCGGVSVQVRSLSRGGFSLGGRGSLSRRVGVSVQGGVSVQEGFCRVGSLSGGVSVQRVSVRETPHIVKSILLLGYSFLVSDPGFPAGGKLTFFRGCLLGYHVDTLITIKAEANPQGRQPLSLIFMSTLYNVS